MKLKKKKNDGRIALLVPSKRLHNMRQTQNLTIPITERGGDWGLGGLEVRN